MSPRGGRKVVSVWEPEVAELVTHNIVELDSDELRTTLELRARADRTDGTIERIGCWGTTLGSEVEEPERGIEGKGPFRDAEEYPLRIFSEVDWPRRLSEEEWPRRLSEEDTPTLIRCSEDEDEENWRILVDITNAFFFIVFKDTFISAIVVMVVLVFLVIIP